MKANSNLKCILKYLKFNLIDLQKENYQMRWENNAF